MTWQWGHVVVVVHVIVIVVVHVVVIVVVHVVVIVVVGVGPSRSAPPSPPASSGSQAGWWCWKHKRPLRLAFGAREGGVTRGISP